MGGPVIAVPSCTLPPDTSARSGFFSVANIPRAGVPGHDEAPETTGTKPALTKDMHVTVPVRMRPEERKCLAAAAARAGPAAALKLVAANGLAATRDLGRHRAAVCESRRHSLRSSCSSREWRSCRSMTRSPQKTCSGMGPRPTPWHGGLTSPGRHARSLESRSISEVMRYASW